MRRLRKIDAGPAIGQSHGLRERFVTRGSEPLSGPPDDLRKYFANEISKWGKVIREAGITADQGVSR